MPHINAHEQWYYQDSILKYIYRHTLSSMLFDGIYKAHHAQILSCFNLGADVWFTIWLIFQSFQLISYFLPQRFEYDLDYPIPQLQVSLNMCAHIPLTLWVFISYVVLITMNA